MAGRIVRGINLVDKAKGGERGGTRFARTAKMSKDCMQFCTRGAKLAKKNVAAISKKTER